MTFWDHIEELRWNLLRVVVVWLVAAIGYFVAMPTIFDDVILAPCRGDFVLYDLLRNVAAWAGSDESVIARDVSIRLVNINLSAPLLIHFSTAFSLSVVSTVPYLLYEMWRFLNPALYAKERRGVKRAFIFGSVMFYVGVAVGYFLIYPMSLQFLASYQLSSMIENTVSLESYIDSFTMLILSMGFAFEMPMILWLLSLMGVITRGALRRYRRHAIVVIVILAAIITPTTDPFTLSILFMPLYLLYELSLMVVRDVDLAEGTNKIS